MPYYGGVYMVPYLGVMREIRAWLRAHGFVIVSERIGLEGIELTVRAPEGRVASLIHRPGRDPMPMLETLEAALYGNFEIEP
jgi:hypothetical protein